MRKEWLKSFIFTIIMAWIWAYVNAIWVNEYKDHHEFDGNIV